MPTRFSHKSTSLKAAIVKKRVFMTFFFLCIAAGVVLIWNGAQILGILPFVAGFFFGLLWHRATQSARRNQAGICSCGEAIAYHSGVAFEKGSEWTTTRMSSTCREIVATTYANGCIHYPCSNCGKVKEFKHMICIRETRKNTAGEILQERQYSSEQAICEFFDDLRFCRKQK